MQQITSLPLLTPLANGAESSNNLASAGLPVAALKPVAGAAQTGAGDFKRVFLAVTEGDTSSPQELLEVQNWQQLLAEQPMPMTALDPGLITLPALAAMPTKGQAPAFLTSNYGEFLPPTSLGGLEPGLGEQELGALVSQSLMDWSAVADATALQEVQDGAGSQTEGAWSQLIDPSMMQIVDPALIGNVGSSGLESLAGMQLTSGADSALGQGDQQSTMANLQQQSATWEGFTVLPGSPSSMLSGLMADNDLAAPVVDQNFNTFAQTLLGRSVLGNDPLKKPGLGGLGLNGTFVAAQHVDGREAANQGLLQIPMAQQGGVGVIDGQNLGLLNNPDALFKSHYELPNRDSSALTELLSFDRGDGVADPRSELQSKSVGVGLREYTTGIGTHVNDPGWGDQLGQKIVWLTGRNIQSAQLHLNPAELGPIEVKISIQNDQTTVAITAHHASTRELLDANVQRLREVLSANGADVSEVSVGADERGNGSASQREHTYDDGDGTNAGNNELGAGQASGADNAPSDEAVAVTTSILNMVDYYA